MKVITTADVKAALRTLPEEERRKVVSWFDHLANWETDERIRKMTKPTIDQGTYALNTSDDFRIFFALNEAKSEIVIMDFGRPSRFAVAGAASE